METSERMPDEEFAQLERDQFMSWPVAFRAVLREARRARAAEDALQKFKEYVHQRLDEAGVPTHPDGPHSKAGCRVGDRLDLLVQRAQISTSGRAGEGPK